MHNSHSTLIVLGILIAVMPFLGFPQGVDDVVYVVAGLFIAFWVSRNGMTHHNSSHTSHHAGDAQKSNQDPQHETPTETQDESEIDEEDYRQ